MRTQLLRTVAGTLASQVGHALARAATGATRLWSPPSGRRQLLRSRRALLLASAGTAAAIAGAALALATRPAAAPPAAPVLGDETRPAVGVTAAVPSSFSGIAEPPPEPPRRTEFATYVVRPGDVLWQVAEKFQLRPETILWTNDLPNPDLLLVGQELRIPPVDGVLYTVRPGDRLADVARRYGVELGAVAAANKLASPDQVQAGADIFLPGARPLKPAARPPAATVQAPPGADPELQAAATATTPLPPNIDQLLAAGWLSVLRETRLYKTAEPGAVSLHALPAGVSLERLDGLRSGRIQVRDPGDGRTRQAMTGWVSAMDVAVGRAPAPSQLPMAYPADTAMDIAHVFAPYRSQLDGSPYAEANCGPTTLAMGLDALGIHVSSAQARAEALDAQRMWGNSVGTLITALASVAERHGATPLDLYAADGSLRRWTLDEIRAHIARGHPVIVQARYRALPRRESAAYYGDHYLLVTGVVPDGFLYNDSVDVDGIGWDRLISPARLRAAMDASDRRYAYAAFALVVPR